ncbi:hypothetical protein CDV55_102503 [Aspergillus turcosus]|nr:hypothetical protein CDV55_102503 [Aspergillus turcosus]
MSDNEDTGGYNPLNDDAMRWYYRTASRIQQTLNDYYALEEETREFHAHLEDVARTLRESCQQLRVICENATPPVSDETTNEFQRLLAFTMNVKWQLFHAVEEIRKGLEAHNPVSWVNYQLRRAAME